MTSATMLGMLPELGLPQPPGNCRPGRCSTHQQRQWQETRQAQNIWWHERMCEVFYTWRLYLRKNINPFIRKFYERLIQHGKEKKVALTACMRKLLVILNAMVRTNQPWRFTAA